MLWRTVPLAAIVVCTSALSNAQWVQWEGNEHWYRVIDGGISWLDAKDAAEEAGGYLATITSQEEDLLSQLNRNRMENWSW